MEHDTAPIDIAEPATRAAAASDPPPRAINLDYLDSPYPIAVTADRILDAIATDPPETRND